MNPEEFIKMMNDLPDEIINSANDSRFKHHRKIWYIVSTVAASFVALFMVAIYPQIRVLTPDICADPAISNDTTQSITNPAISSFDQISVTLTKSEISESSETNLDSESSSTSALNTITSTKVSSEETSAIVSTIEPTTSQTIEAHTTEIMVVSTIESQLSTHSEATTISTLSDQSTITTTINSETPIEYDEIKYYKEIGMLPSAISDDVTESCAFDLYGADVPSWIFDEYDYLYSIDFNKFDLLLVSIYTKSEDISIVGGALLLDSMNMVLYANSLMLDEDSPCNLYLFFLQIPKNILTEQFKYTMDFQYQYADDYSKESSVGTIYVKRVVANDDEE